MKIDILYFIDCPSWQNALKNLQIVLMEEGIEISINPIEVKSDGEAIETKFLGSPSFQINGQDLWPEERSSYSMSCRVYRTPDGFRGWPTIEMLRQKLIEFTTEKDKKK